jgi:hypothetical protein
MLEWCWTAQVGEQRGVDVETAVGGGFENAGWDEEAEGDGHDEIWRVGRGRCPGGEGVDLVDGD